MRLGPGFVMDLTWKPISYVMGLGFGVWVRGLGFRFRVWA